MTLQAAISRIDQIISFEQQALPAHSDRPASPSGFSSALASATAAPGATPAEISPAWRRYQPLVEAAAARYHVPVALIDAVIQHESGFDPHATSSAGAQGLMQLMPGTAAGLGVTNAYDPAQNIDGGAKYLREQLDTFGGNVSLALAAYDAGAAAVERYHGIPPYPETQAYVPAALALYRRFSALLSSTQEGPT